MPPRPLPPETEHSTANPMLSQLGDGAVPRPQAPPDGAHVLRGTRPGDHVEGPFSFELAGLGLRFRLSSGGVQFVTFGVDDVTMTGTDATGVAQAPVRGIY